MCMYKYGISLLALNPIFVDKKKKKKLKKIDSSFQRAHKNSGFRTCMVSEHKVIVSSISENNILVVPHKL